MILDQETINWISVEQQLPDDNMTVLVCASTAGEPVWLGWYEDGCWIGVDAEAYEDDQVTAWAKIPRGPERDGRT